MTVFTAVMLSFFWTICTHGSDQVVLQRYFSTTSIQAARRSYLVNALTDLTIGTLLALCGLALLAFYLQHPTFLPEQIMVVREGRVVINHGDRVLPHFFAHQLPAGIGGVVLAVLLCDAMQTLVSGVNSISAVFAADLLARGKAAGQSQRNELRQARLLTVVVGLLVTGLGIGVAYLARHSGRNIIDMMGPAFNIFLGPLAGLFLIGMFLNCNARAAIPAVIASVGISFVWSYWKEVFGTSYQPSITLSTAVPYLASFAIAALLGSLMKKNPDDPGLAFTWRAVMRRE
jgi:SSS family solute:Na+ symporter